RCRRPPRAGPRPRPRPRSGRGGGWPGRPTATATPPPPARRDPPTAPPVPGCGVPRTPTARCPQPSRPVGGPATRRPGSYRHQVPQLGEPDLSDAGDLAQLLHRLEGPVLGPVGDDPLGQRRPDAGQGLQLRLASG